MLMSNIAIQLYRNSNYTNFSCDKKFSNMVNIDDLICTFYLPTDPSSVLSYISVANKVTELANMIEI